MGIHRGGSQLWASVSVAANDTSELAVVGGSNVMLYVDNEGANSHTFKVQVARRVKAGWNEATSAADGGLIWYDLQEKDLSANVEVTVASGENKAIDLSPFAGSFIRLVCTTGTANNISAYVTWNGPS